MSLFNNLLSVIHPNSQKIISPLADNETLNSPEKLWYVADNQAHEAAAAKANQNPVPYKSKTVQYPSWMSNAPSDKQKIAIATIRANSPQSKATDADIIKAYNKYGDKLLQGLNPVGIVKPEKAVLGANTNQEQNNNQPTEKPQQVMPEAITPHKQSSYTFKFQGAIDRAAKQTGLPMEAFHLLRSSENMGEKPDAVNYNNNGTLDVGLFQVNVSPSNKQEIENLKNPEYNALKAATIFKQRLNVLKDPVLAVASYNLGAGGAVLNPDAAINRAKLVYSKAGLPMPQTPFTKNPQAFVQNNMQYYQSMGLFGN